jgi:hypothetical protein
MIMRERKRRTMTLMTLRAWTTCEVCRFFDFFFRMDKALIHYTICLACCNGKHDIGSLRNGHAHHHHRNQRTPSSASRRVSDSVTPKNKPTRSPSMATSTWSYRTRRSSNISEDDGNRSLSGTVERRGHNRTPLGPIYDTSQIPEPVTPSTAFKSVRQKSVGRRGLLSGSRSSPSSPRV